MTERKHDRRKFLISGAAGLAGVAIFRNIGGEMFASAEDGVFPEIVEMSISEARAKMSSGQLTSRRLVEMYLERIKQIDPQLHSVIEVNPDALSIADQLDRERKRGNMRSALHGMPILIKDNIDTADKMLTTAGSLALVDAPVPKRDAFVITRLRKAGAVILGKTNLSEWANFRSTRSISGWSGRGGQTNNPYFLDQNPCGSSSGSGVAVSANLAMAAVGTETNGSIICPAVTNGVVGIKPTLTLVSRSGIIPIAPTQDTAGPMARTVTDAAILLSGMVGSDKRDFMIPFNGKPPKKDDYTRFLDVDGLKGARLGLVMQYTTRTEVKEFFEPFIRVLREAGATLIDVNFTPDYTKLGDDRTNVLKYEFNYALRAYLTGRGAKYKTLDDLIKFNDENKDRELIKFGQELFIDSAKKGELNSEYLDALHRIRKATRDDGIDAVMTKDKLDALVGPTSGATWSIAAVAGHPYITVPVGLRENTPSGMGFFGRPYSEPQLIKYAYAFEQRTKGRVVPKLLPTYPKKTA